MKFLRYPFPLLIGVFVSLAHAQQPEKKPASPSENRSASQLSPSPMPARQTPHPSSEMQRVADALIGTWSIAEKYEPDEWTPKGGVGQGEEVWRPGPGGFTLMEEYHSKNPGGETFGLALMWWDADKGFQGIWCVSDNPKGCDSSGIANGATANGATKWENNELVINTEFERNGKKLVWHEVFSEITPTSFTQTADMGEKGGTLKRWVTIHATRVAQVKP